MSATRSQRLLIAAAILAVLAGLGFGLAAMWRLYQASQPVRPRLEVAARFKAIRESPGHIIHIQTARLECAACHAIADAERKHFDVPDSNLCVRCHGALPLTMHASVLAQAGTECLNCHTFGEDYTIRPDNCVRCHGQGQGFIEPIVIHGKEACVGCHRVHQEPSLVPKPCTSCHDKVGDARHAPNIAGAVLCLDCHRSHDNHTAADQRCADCHRGERAQGTRIPATALSRFGHRKCVGCHAPHDFSRAGVRPCAACHEQPTLGRSTEHKQCRTCHPPHQVRADDARVLCVTCHLQEAENIDHPAVLTPADGPCIGCHAAHPRGPAPQCATCHAPGQPETAFHAGQIACRDCHEPHRVKLRARELCTTGCHSAETLATRENPGHQQCANCHVDAAHRPSAPSKTCAACHTKEKNSAPMGHARCADCHETHAGTVIKNCAQCHEPQAKQGHQRVPERCAACHRAHGPKGVAKPPTCRECHAPSRLPGLHRNDKHRTCADCHRAHESAPYGDRISCLRCHKQQVAHEPTAKLCIGCHVFKK
jgi:hypothetical protein